MGCVVINLEGYEVFEKTVSKFGNGAHVLIPKKYQNRKLKIIIGKPIKIIGKEIKIDFFGNEILERKVSKFGTGFHVTIPKECLDKKIKIIGENFHKIDGKNKTTKGGLKSKND